MDYKKFIPLVAAVVLTVAGCAPTFPPHVTDKIDRSVKFSDVLKNPQVYKGKTVMLAGTIIDVKAEKDGSAYIEIIERPKGRSGKPLDTDQTEGRFMAVTKQFLDPAVYRKGRPITIVGEIIGDSVKPLGEMVYRYPLLRIDAAHLWEPSTAPRVSFGFGIGIYHGF